ncbi:uncharacterized protein LOC142986140 [Anticarsia gemmatalis]|uniref:uncharacterized protein LOC142986140 n=1 Tax=Anticarsia gemmatalis TaxID=129554 RepID=UPI003F75D96C
MWTEPPSTTYVGPTSAPYVRGMVASVPLPWDAACSPKSTIQPKEAARLLSTAAAKAVKSNNRNEDTREVEGQRKLSHELDEVHKKHHEDNGSERKMLLQGQADLMSKSKQALRAELNKLRHREATLTAVQGHWALGIYILRQHQH